MGEGGVWGVTYASYRAHHESLVHTLQVYHFGLVSEVDPTKYAQVNAKQPYPLWSNLLIILT